MKLLTLNTHSLIEKNYQKKLCDFTKAVKTEQPDIIALQEVNQSFDADKIPFESLHGYFECDKKVVIKKDNHVLNAAKILLESGIDYSWTYLPIKLGYGRYEEGLALMSRSRIIGAKWFTVSADDDYTDWKTRKILGICVENNPDEWFFSVHYGWWDDENEPFDMQWRKTLELLPYNRRIWLLGDFNNPAHMRNEGYDMISDSGWYDSYESAEHKDDGITASTAIDGWKTKNCERIRIDQIWCNENTDISYSRVVFNGVDYPAVSDHCGVMVETKGD